MTTLRERKRDRTREALVASANRLFAERGFDGVTVAEIAEEADVGARTFFAYFPTKEDLLFPDAGGRVDAAVAALREHAPDDDPLPALMRALDSVGVTGGDLTSERARLRLRLIAEHPAVQSRALRFQADAETAIAAALRESYPDRYDAVEAAALVGAFMGAVTAALRAAFAEVAGEVDEERIRARVRAAAELALAPWLGAAGPTPEAR
ncbi:TetR/AcrR family transcriptional regulator [Leifsonia shinshuensis]|uniref:TetR family transcriptional regulator n=1 Tax=Leifsonia shinshuensis TaxID=150026 RepID=UPI001F50D3DE|nr:TetR family transcriptional regulator [Leifsonia shinshuensis]MCI0159266.1 TetR/AcrR family transcriptional regulator [Leifsonia shinshuensis]